jgi:hypothetical protein
MIDGNFSGRKRACREKSVDEENYLRNGRSTCTATRDGHLPYSFSMSST